MTTNDWRDVSAEEIVPLLQAERRRFVETLHWDLGPALKMVEAARQRGEVPGLILRDSKGQPAGWAFYLLAGRQLQIGAVQAKTAGGVRLLLDRILSSPEAELAQSLSCFLCPTSASVASALVRQRFELQRHLYLEAPLATMPGVAQTGSHTFGPLAEGDGAPAVRLLARAYAGESTARCFAPNARLDEWAQYLGQTLSTPSIGRFLPEASFIAKDSVSAAQGMIVTTE